MKPRRLVELRNLLAHPDFQSFWGGLERARRDHEAARHQYDELLAHTTMMEFRAELTQKNAIDTLYRAGELEDRAATLMVEAQTLENRSLLLVADFEEQRFKASELWYRLGAAERAAEERRDAHADKVLRQTAADYERENARKEQLWQEVERTWTRAAEVSLLVSEHKSRGRKIRKDAETLFALAEERKVRAKELRGQADQAALSVDAQQKQLLGLMDDARERFGCATGTDFLFFRVKDNQKLAFAVSLIEDPDNFNLEVKPLAIYVVDRQRGVGFLEPARPEVPSEEEGDRRFEQYFLSGRKGEVRALRS